jgi:anti-sigma factor RsiW
VAGCEDRLKDLALHAGGDLEEPAASELEKHLAGCVGCRGELEEMKKSMLVAAAFSPEPPGRDEFLNGVKAARGRIARKRALSHSMWAAAAAVLLVLVLAAPFLRRGPDSPDGGTGVAQAGPVEVERVGYSEAVVSVIPTNDESMTIVWIVSDEVGSGKKGLK